MTRMTWFMATVLGLATTATALADDWGFSFSYGDGCYRPRSCYTSVYYDDDPVVYRVYRPRPVTVYRDYYTPCYPTRTVVYRESSPRFYHTTRTYTTRTYYRSSPDYVRSYRVYSAPSHHYSRTYRHYDSPRVHIRGRGRH